MGWNPEPFYMMLGEITRESMENPPVRIANRRIMQPAFTKDAMVGYIDKVRPAVKPLYQPAASVLSQLQNCKHGV